MIRPDYDGMRAHLLLALAMGLSACPDDVERKPEHLPAPEVADPNPRPEAVTAPEQPALGDQTPNTGDTAPPPPAGPNAGDQLGSTADRSPAIIDPNGYCASPRQWLTVEDADTKRTRKTKDKLGCPRSTEPMRGRGRMVGFLDTAKTQALRDAGDTEHCCYRVSRRLRGRPLMLADRAWLPGFEFGSRRAVPTSTALLERRVALRSAAGWLRDARLEWASVSSFERAAAELHQLGAPATLLERYHDAAHDERRHTAQCLRWAEHYAGRVIRLADRPPVAARPGDRAACLRRTFSEGCVAETAAALVAAHAATRSAPTIASDLRRIAEDESEHARLAWTTVGWLLARCTSDERTRFLTWARAQRTEPAADGADPDAVHGRLSRATEHAITSAAWDRCILPLLDHLDPALGQLA